jgi:hypothetical protein
MKNCPINSKAVMKNLFDVRFPCKSLNFWFRISKQEVPKPMEILTPEKIFMTIFEFVE